MVPPTPLVFFAPSRAVESTLDIARQGDPEADDATDAPPRRGVCHARVRAEEVDMRKAPLLRVLIALTAVTASCRGERTLLAELEHVKAREEVERQNVARCRQMFEEIDKGNAESLNEFFAADVESYAPSGSGVAASREDLVRATKAFLQGFPDLHHTIEEAIAAGDWVTVRFTAAGTHRGVFGGVAPTGNEMKLSVISMMRFAGGRIVEVRQEADTLGMMQQLGMELRPAAMQ
jgi:predicted ester cyclase